MVAFDGDEHETALAGLVDVATLEVAGKNDWGVLAERAPCVDMSERLNWTPFVGPWVVGFKV